MAFLASFWQPSISGGIGPKRSLNTQYEPHDSIYIFFQLPMLQIRKDGAQQPKTPRSRRQHEARHSESSLPLEMQIARGDIRQEHECYTTSPEKQPVEPPEKPLSQDRFIFNSIFWKTEFPKLLAPPLPTPYIPSRGVSSIFGSREG